MTDSQLPNEEMQIKTLVTTTTNNVLALFCTKNNEGKYSFNSYFSYHDVLSDQTVHEILSSKKPSEQFYDAIYDAYLDTILAKESIIINEVVKELQQNKYFAENNHLSNEEAEDIICDYMNTHVSNEALYEHFLNQEVALNIIIDTGDLNTDFTENNLCNYYAPNPEEAGEGEELVSDESSLLLLCKTQGITKRELEEAIIEGTGYKGDAANIVLLKNTLNQELQKLGKDIYMNHYHKGPYKQYLNIKEEKQLLTEKHQVLKKTLAANSISFSEYQAIVKEKNLPMNITSEEAFTHHQERVLMNLQEKLHIIEEKITALSQNTPEIEKAELLSEELFDLLNKKYKTIRNTAAFQKMSCLDSILDESRESTTHMNALTFCVKMPFKQALQIQEIKNREQEYNKSYYAHERTGNSFIVLDKNTTCGLYDSWNGAGGQFGIQLVNDIKLPIKYIFSMDIDGALGYSIKSIFSREEDMWVNHSIKDIVEQKPDITHNKNANSLANIIVQANEKQLQSEQQYKNKDHSIKER